MTSSSKMLMLATAAAVLSSIPPLQPAPYVRPKPKAQPTEPNDKRGKVKASRKQNRGKK
jgi:hypothetical protein